MKDGSKPAFSYKNTQAQLNPPPPPRNNFNAPPGFQARAPFNLMSIKVLISNLLQFNRKATWSYDGEPFSPTNNFMAQQVGQLSKAPGHFPGNSEQPPKAHINAVILRNGKELQDHPLKEPSKRTVEETVQTRKWLARAKLEKKYGKFLDILKKLHINIPFLEAISEMPSYAKFLKDMLSNKRKIEENATVSLTAECSAILQNKLPKKLGDPGSYSIPVKLGDMK
ncbi:uncharacterized protein LOC130590844 [Beta vulgaris subsp. vulgaris]|uniref:uncharacterized protein LOC130590844 n=1 Tax=Beta vulgaris subsp. vulgaris TaxID=3555 RepID=UPI00254851CF|nr:uncharacterized protein LOC130590844 [Beta vulgaris subsp. vulgaris]